MRSLPHFIAIDGEGRNVDGVGSEHLYTLIANSCGDIWENIRDGLGSAEIFDTLITWRARYPDATFVGFATNYDVNMMLRDVPRDMLERLWKIGRTYWTDYTRDAIYRIEYIPSKWFSVIPQARDHNGRLQSIPGSGMRLWDVWGFFQARFTKILEDWLTPVELGEVGAFIGTMKEARGEFSPEMQPLIRRYCITECKMLVKVMDKLAKSLWEADLPISSWLGAGAIATKMLQDNAVKHSLEWEQWSEDVKNASMWAYFGGRVEIFQQGIIPGPIYDYDIQSAYPSAINALPFLRNGTWSKGTPSGASHVHQLVHVEWDTRETPYYWLAPFPQHFESGRVAWESVGEGWYHNTEWWAAKNLFGDAIKELNCWEFTPVSPYATPFAFVKNSYARKAELKRRADPRYYPLKVGLNSLYGKLAQSMGRTGQWGPPPYQNYYLAGKVTAEIRARMLMALANAGHASAVMVATDGLFTRKKINHLVPSDKLGGWERSEMVNGMTLVQAGVWWEPGDEKARRRTRGFGVHSVSYSDACALFAYRMSDSPGNSAYPDHVYQETRFIGLGYCVNTGDWSKWRRWLQVERTLSADLLPHKQVNMVDGELWGYVSEHVRHDPMKRRPYTLRRERMAEPDPEQLDAIVETEQPEGAGQ